MAEDQKKRIEHYKATVATFKGESAWSIELVQFGSDRPCVALWANGNLLTASAADLETISETFAHLAKIAKRIGFDPQRKN